MKKKILLMAAASALMLTACTSEDDILQTGLQKQAATQEVGFDVYTPAATNVTRAGQAGTMTTNRLQRTEAKGGGFGVYAYLVADESDGSTATSYIDWMSRTSPSQVPNVMVNEKILWNATNQGWYYNPLKYWPNETDNDSQNTNAEMEAIGGNKHLDRLTFFAYAPYVSEGNTTNPGITHVTAKDGKLWTKADGTGTAHETVTSVIEPSIGYKASLDDPEKAVDLLWGVAPAGGFTYTAVNGQPVEVKEGEPLVDMTKPDVNTNMKFLFQHALARIGVNVVAAIDQVGAGGKLDANETKITIDKITLTGKFGATGVLNLDNSHANVANWVKINSTNITNETTSLPDGDNVTLVLSADKGTIAPWLRYKGEHTFGEFSAQNVTGVTTTRQDVITPRYYPLDGVPAYSPTKQYYTEANAKYTVSGGDAYYTESSGNYTKVASSTVIYDDGTGYYKITEGATTYPSSGAQPASSADWDFYTKDGDTYTFKGTGSAAGWGSGSDTYYVLTVKSAVSDIPFVYNNKAVATYTVTGSEGYYTYNGTNKYTPQEAVSINAPAIGSTNTGLFTLVATGTGDNESCPDPAATYYTLDAGVYTVAGLGSALSWNQGSLTKTYYRITPTAVPSTSIDFAYSGTIYDVERNYFMVVPTNNIETLNTTLSDAQKEALRKVRVKIEYYVTTEDDKVEGDRTQTKNVIEKDVLFPSLANGKSYNLNLVLGLTSVKMEAEVDDWKVINVQGDLPQNTAE